MAADTLQKELIGLYKTTLGYEFDKVSYATRMEALKETHARLLAETAHACDTSEEERERLAAAVPEYVAGQLAAESSRRKREMKSLDHKMNMVSYFVPLMGEIPSEYSKAFTERMVEIWNERMPGNKIGHSTYEGIQGGFRRSVSCYITTAVCRSLDKPDDCYELTTLRNYRDGYLLASDTGKDLVEEYYNIAPTIVKRISRQPDAGEIYRGIWEDYLSTCIRLIEEDRKEECRELYTQMVRSLETRYLYS